MTGMTAAQLQAYRDVLKAGKVKPEKVSTEWVFQRAWNEGVEYAERQLDKTIRETTA